MKNLGITKSVWEAIATHPDPTFTVDQIMNEVGSNFSRGQVMGSIQGLIRSKKVSTHSRAGGGKQAVYKIAPNPKRVKLVKRVKSDKGQIEIPEGSDILEDARIGRIIMTAFKNLEAENIRLKAKLEDIEREERKDICYLKDCLKSKDKKIVSLSHEIGILREKIKTSGVAIAKLGDFAKYADGSKNNG